MTMTRNLLSSASSQTSLPSYASTSSDPLPTYPNTDGSTELRTLERAQVDQKSRSAQRLYHQDPEAQDPAVIAPADVPRPQIEIHQPRAPQRYRQARGGRRPHSIRASRVAGVALVVVHIAFFAFTWKLAGYAYWNHRWYNGLPRYWKYWVDVARWTRWYAMIGIGISVMTNVPLYPGEDQLKEDGTPSRQVAIAQQLVKWESLVLFMVLTFQFLHW